MLNILERQRELEELKKQCVFDMIKNNEEHIRLEEKHDEIKDELSTIEDLIHGE